MRFSVPGTVTSAMRPSCRSTGDWPVMVDSIQAGNRVCLRCADGASLRVPPNRCIGAGSSFLITAVKSAPGTAPLLKKSDGAAQVLGLGRDGTPGVRDRLAMALLVNNFL